MDSARGQLLIAGPTLLDPNFWRTVVLVVEHTDEGALGLVLNRPSETVVSDAVPELEQLIDGDELLYIGGPVQPAAVVVLARFEDPSDSALIAFDDVGVLGSGDSTESAGVIEGRAFVGHAGWGSGQLDSEIERGDWILEPARRPAQGALTYGLGRVEILSAQGNGATLLVLALVIVYVAIRRLLSPPHVGGAAMIAVACAGIAVNLLVARILAGDGQPRSLNVEGSYRHILTDL